MKCLLCNRQYTANSETAFNIRLNRCKETKLLARKFNRN